MPVLRRIALLALAVGAALVVPTGAASADPSTQDQTWLVAAHQGNLAEIAAGQAAVDQGSSDAVKRLGQMMVDDHTKLDADLTAAAQQASVALPTTPTEDQQASLKALEAIDGSAFDEAWISAQIGDHRAAIAAGKTEQADGSDAAVMALAEAAAPVVQRHLSELEDQAKEPQSANSGSSPHGGHSAWWYVAAIVVVGIVLAAVVYVSARRRSRRRAGSTVGGPDVT